MVIFWSRTVETNETNKKVIYKNYKVITQQKVLVSIK